jgi:hypothetical protein
MTYVHFCVKGEMCHLLHSQGYISLQRIASITSTISATLRRIIRTSLVVSSWLERDSFRTMNASNHTQICPFDVVDVTCFSANRATLSVTTNTVLSSSNNNVFDSCRVSKRQCFCPPYAEALGHLLIPSKRNLPILERCRLAFRYLHLGPTIVLRVLPDNLVRLDYRLAEEVCMQLTSM